MYARPYSALTSHGIYRPKTACMEVHCPVVDSQRTLQLSESDIQAKHHQGNVHSNPRRDASPSPEAVATSRMHHVQIITLRDGYSKFTVHCRGRVTATRSKRAVAGLRKEGINTLKKTRIWILTESSLTTRASLCGYVNTLKVYSEDLYIKEHIKIRRQEGLYRNNKSRLLYFGKRTTGRHFLNQPDAW